MLYNYFVINENINLTWVSIVRFWLYVSAKKTVKRSSYWNMKFTRLHSLYLEGS